jgi:ketosteroid isomerase-like protein
VSRENVEIARRSFEGWNRDEFDAWARPGTYHEEVEVISDISRRVEGAEWNWRGPTGLRQFWEEARSVWGSSIKTRDIRDLGDTVLVLGELQTRGQASGVAVDSLVAYVFEFDEGLIRRVRLYLDPGDAFKAVGLQE